MEKYFSFKGEASRSEYWAINLISGVVAFVVGFMVGIIVAAMAFTSTFNPVAIVGVLIFVAILIMFIIINCAAAVRRCRQAGINPWWTLALFIPYIGFITMIVLGCLKPDPDRVIIQD